MIALIGLSAISQIPKFINIIELFLSPKFLGALALIKELRDQEVANPVRVCYASASAHIVLIIIRAFRFKSRIPKFDYINNCVGSNTLLQNVLRSFIVEYEPQEARQEQVAHSANQRPGCGNGKSQSSPTSGAVCNWHIKAENRG